MYSLVMLLGALLLLGVQRVLRHGSRRKRDLVLVAVVSALGVATNYFFVPVVMAAGVILFLKGNMPPAARRLLVRLFVRLRPVEWACAERRSCHPEHSEGDARQEPHRSRRRTRVISSTAPITV